MGTELRVLGPGDESALFSFLLPRLETSLFLVSNAESAGLQDRGEALQATYVAHVVDGAFTAVAAHCWNGVLMLQGDQGLEAAAQRATDVCQRRVNGLIGPLPLTQRARSALGLAQRRAAKDDSEVLFSLELEQVIVPELLLRPEFELRRATLDEVEQPLGGWRADYLVTALGARPTPELANTARADLQRSTRAGMNFILLRAGEPVSMTQFNARARGVVQVGGVWTPPHLRGRGYARAAVAGSLLIARAEGAHKSVLFTGKANLAAVAAYQALGYRPFGEWGLVLFDPSDA